jgi:hypothetical protein
VTVDLVEFLEQRIREDEQLARMATPGPWRYNPGKQWFTDLDKLRAARAGIPMSGGEEFVGAGPDDGDNATTIGVAATGPADDPQSMTNADFIARWDPARVLAECEARRFIINMHQEAEHMALVASTPAAAAIAKAVVATTRSVLETLAAVDSSHPDYPLERTR